MVRVPIGSFFRLDSFMRAILESVGLGLDVTGLDVIAMLELCRRKAGLDARGESSGELRGAS
jgi:hypothetical protein